VSAAQLQCIDLVEKFVAKMEEKLESDVHTPHLEEHSSIRYKGGKEQYFADDEEEEIKGVKSVSDPHKGATSSSGTSGEAIDNNQVLMLPKEMD
jgi:hypothetical protein